MGNQLLSRPVYILARNLDHFKKIKAQLNTVVLFGYEPIYLDRPDRIRGIRTAVVFFEKDNPPTDFELHVMYQCHALLLEVNMKETNNG